MSIRTQSRLDVLNGAGTLRSVPGARPEGCVSQVIGLTVESAGPRVSVGDLVWIDTPSSLAGRVPAEVVGFRDRGVVLMPVEHLSGIRPGARVIPGGRLHTRAGYGFLGRIVDGLGRPIDEKPEPLQSVEVDIDRAAPPPLHRERLTQVFATGIRSLDGLVTCAKGQRMGIFAGSGVGKSVLLGSLARHSCATVNVISLIGERGREVREFVEKSLGPGLAKSVVVVATADQSPLMRIKGAATAMAFAEYFREQGEHVLLLMDSLTRYAMAQREIGLAAGEPPTTKGYPPSVFGLLARLLERSGSSRKGTITAFFSVLVEADDLNDPIADAVRAILDGHIVLSRSLAEMNHYPAVDVLSSVSRLMNDVVNGPHRDLAAKCRGLLAAYRKAEDLVNVGAYVAGSNQRIDEALKKIDSITHFLRQRPEETSDFQATTKALEKALS